MTVDAVPGLAIGPKARSSVRQVATEHGLWALIVGTHLAIGIIAGALGRVNIIGPNFLGRGWGYFLDLIALTLYWPLPLLVWRRLQVRDAAGNRVPWHDGWRFAFQRWWHDMAPARLLGVLVAVTLIVLTLHTHDAWKSTIGLLEPYQWDQSLSTLDYALHGGRYPWEWLQRVLGTPEYTHWIDVSYALWYPLYTTILIWQCWNPNRRVRARFFVTFALTWVILGTIVAHLLASGGPVFYGGLVRGPDPYAPLRAYLAEVHRTIPLTAVTLQEAVWTNYVSGARSFWISMSAMPSLHVGMAALFALSFWPMSRVLGILLWAYTFVMMVGSVHLGWHYAVDAYAGVIGTWACWRVSEWALRRTETIV